MQHLRIKLSIFINFFLFAIFMNSVGPVILQVQQYYHMSALSASVLEPCKDISIAVASFIVASIIARAGYKKSMLLSLALMVITCFLVPLIHTFFAIKLFFIVMGACFGFMKVSVFGTIGLITRDRKEHIRLMNFTEGIFMAGILGGYFLFGYYIGDARLGAAGWLTVYTVLGVLTAIAFCLLWASPLDERVTKPVQVRGLGEGLVSMGRLMVLPVVTSFILCAFFYVLVEQSIMSWLPTFNYNVLRLPSSLSIQTAGILAAAMAAGRITAGVVIKRVKWFTVLSVSLLGAAILLCVALQLPHGLGEGVGSNRQSVPLTAFIFPLTGFFIAPIYPAINSIILSSLPKAQHGVMSGLIVVVSAMGGSLGSLTTGFIFERYSGEAAFYFSLLPIAVLLLLLFYFERITGKIGAGSPVQADVKDSRAKEIMMPA